MAYDEDEKEERVRLNANISSEKHNIKFGK